jgi:DNA-binding MarR family transcriptional regulator
VSYKLVDLCFDIPGLKLGEQSVLMAICRHASNKTYDCYPSREVIASLARMNVRQVARIIPALVEKGLITRDSGKGRKSTNYTVTVDTIRQLIGSQDIKPPQEEEDEDQSEHGSSGNMPRRGGGDGLTLTP